MLPGRVFLGTRLGRLWVGSLLCGARAALLQECRAVRAGLRPAWGTVLRVGAVLELGGLLLLPVLGLMAGSRPGL